MILGAHEIGLKSLHALEGNARRRDETRAIDSRRRIGCGGSDRLAAAAPDGMALVLVVGIGRVAGRRTEGGYVFRMALRRFFMAA